MGLCSILFIVPPWRNVRFFKAYVVISLSLMISGFIHTTHGKLFVVTNVRKTVLVKMTELAENVFGVLASIITTITTIFIFPEKIKQYLKTINELVRKNPTADGKKKRWFYVTFIGTNISIIFFLSLKRIYWSVNNYYRFNYLKDFNLYQITVAVFLYFWLAIEILERFRNLTENMESFVGRLYRSKKLFKGYTVKILSVEPVAIRQLQDLSKIHSCLTGTLDELNKVFGYPILFYVLFTISFTVDRLVVSIWYTDLSNHAQHGLIDGSIYRLINMQSIVAELVSILFCRAISNHGFFFNLKVDSIDSHILR
ncbi:hypothetical protein JTB14_019826 [Gonioctena quinquepunctata]|nr:hypothetical protein JTB14_019826 [Gonioctena quinquepunctata]